MLVRRFSIVCLCVMLFGMALAVLVAKGSRDGSYHDHRISARFE